MNSIDLSHRKLTEIPDWVFDKKNTTTLDLSHNSISEIDERILDLENLETIILESNSFKEFPKVLFKIKKLEILDISNNQLRVIDKNIKSIIEIKHLSLRNCQLESIPNEISKLTKLVILDVSENHLVELPVEISKLKRLKRIKLNNNPDLKIPSEIINQGIKALFNYLKLSLKKKTEKINEAKLIIVGDGNVGKTFLKEKLIKNEINPKIQSTEGISIDKWNVTNLGENITFNFWDFGGQEIYHSTHQFFLSQRTLYLFVWNARTDDNIMSFDYWLNVIRLLSNNSPVIIIQSKIDERIKNIDEVTFKKRYPNIVGFHNVSAISGAGIDELKNDILQSVFRLEHIGDELPMCWKNLKNKLLNLEKDFISIYEYNNICKEFGLPKEEASILRRYYHDLGVFLNFEDNQLLKELIFINPQWATKAVYIALDTKSIIQNKGKFEFKELKKIWKEYPSDKFLYLLELMKKFELTFNIPDTFSYILPELLPAQKPAFNWNEDNNLCFEYHYEFLPKGVLSRLIVRLHNQIKNEYFWKNGMIVSYENTTALIELDEFAKTLVINIDGLNKVSLLEIIRYEIEVINRTLNFPDIVQRIPCICEVCQPTNKPYMFIYDEVKKAKSKQRDTIECRNSFIAVNIEELLGNIQSNKKIVRIEDVYNLILELKEANDTRESLLEKANDVIQLKPNFMGLGIDINRIIDRILNH